MRVLVPPPRESKFHEVASATDVGRSSRRREDTHAVFTLPGPEEAWPILVLAVADGQGGRSSGRLASAVAIDTFGEALSKALATVAFESWTWQAQATDAIEFAVQRANTEVRALGADREPGREPATGLTAVILFANWMAVVHLGRGRAWRLTRTELEQLTADRSAPNVLGLQAQVLPDVHFLRAEAGEMIAVSSDGLYRYVDGEELAQWLSGREGVMEILVDLLTAVQDRGGEEDTSLCLCRVRRLPDQALPEPAPRPDRAIVAADLPHFPVAPAPKWRPAQLVFALATILVAVGAIGGGLGWWSETPKVDELGRGWVAVPAPVQAPASTAPDVAQADSVARPAVTVGPVSPDTAGLSPRAAAVPPPAPVIQPEKPVAAPAPAPVVVAGADSIRAADSARRARRDSIRAESRRRDSIDAAALAARAIEEQRFRDSVAGAMEALRREREAADQRARAESAARAEAARQLAARAQADQEARDRQLARITAGRAALGTWLLEIDRQSARGNRASPAIAVGPASYQGFIASNKPVVEGARFANMDVNDSTGVATAEWTLKWRTEFGTGSERKVRARAEAVREGDTWRVRSWRILEGGP
jgi:serine/threonine protein phosphatase PrpC